MSDLDRPSALKPPDRIIESDLSAQQRYYDHLWADVPAVQLNAHERARRETIARTLDWLSSREPRPWTITEVGCGRGWLSGLVLSEYGRVQAFDLSPDSVAKAREAFPHVDWHVRDVFASPLAPTSDLVVSSEVIEHVADQPAFVDRLVSAARPSGWILITTPNGAVAREYQRRPDFRRQPMENVLDPHALADLLAPACRVARTETCFFGQGSGWLQRFAASARVRAYTSRSRGRDPLSRIFSQLRLGLYLVVLAQRRS